MQQMELTAAAAAMHQPPFLVLQHLLVPPVAPCCRNYHSAQPEAGSATVACGKQWPASMIDAPGNAADSVCQASRQTRVVVLHVELCKLTVHRMYIR
jgi:hypothetical protein